MSDCNVRSVGAVHCCLGSRDVTSAAVCVSLSVPGNVWRRLWALWGQESESRQPGLWATQTAEGRAESGRAGSRELKIIHPYHGTAAHWAELLFWTCYAISTCWDCSVWRAVNRIKLRQHSESSIYWRQTLALCVFVNCGWKAVPSLIT